MSEKIPKLKLRLTTEQFEKIEWFVVKNKKRRDEFINQYMLISEPRMEAGPTTKRRELRIWMLIPQEGTAAMAIRLLMSLRDYDYRRSPQHTQNAEGQPRREA